MRLHDKVGEMFTAPLWQFVQTTELATLAMYTREGASPPAAFYAAQRFCERKHAPFTAVEGTRFQFVTAYSANPKVLKRDLATDLEEFTRLAGLGQARVHYGMAFKSVMGRFVALLKPIVPDIESRFQLTLERLDEYLKQVPPAPLTEEQLRPKDWCDPEADGALEIDLAGPLDPQRAEAALLERLDPELHAEVREGKRKPEGVDFTAGWTEHSRMLRETTEERSLGMALALPASQYSAQENAQANGFELRRDSVDIDVAQAFDPDCKAPAPKKKPPKPKPEPPLSMPLSMVEMAARGIDDAAPAPEATLNQLVAQTIAIDQVHFETHPKVRGHASHASPSGAALMALVRETNAYQLKAEEPQEAEYREFVAEATGVAVEGDGEGGEGGKRKRAAAKKRAASGGKAKKARK